MQGRSLWPRLSEQPPVRRLEVGTAILGAITAVGTLWFRFVEGWTWTDALYMTVITVSTVGFGEVNDLDTSGQLFTIALILGGVGTVLYLLASLAEIVFEGRLQAVLGRRAMERRIESFENHVIVCGYGRFGRSVTEELQSAGRELVIVENDALLEKQMVEAQLPFIVGSALSEEVLEQAGIRRAQSLVVALPSESDAVFVTLTAREINPALVIHVRAENESTVRRLRRAGANHVTSPVRLGGARMAASIARPAVTDFLEIARAGHGEEIDLEQISVSPASPLGGRAIEALESENPRLRVVALKRASEPISLVPAPSTRIEPGDSLVVIGERSTLAGLARLAHPG